MYLQWGSSTQDSCVKQAGELPIQILGLVATDPEDAGFPCLTFKAVPGDFNSFLYEYPSVSSSVAFELWKQDNTGLFVKVADLIDNTYGIYYGIGFTSDYPTYAGYRIEWANVFSAFGSGNYQFRVIDSVTPSNTLISQPFMLMSNTPENTNYTCKLVFEQSGVFPNFRYSNTNQTIKTFDISKINWADSCRYGGRFEGTPTQSSETYIDQNNDLQNPAFFEDIDEYNIIIKELTQDLYKRLYRYGMRSQSIKATDYNLDNGDVYNNVDIISKASSEYVKGFQNRNIFQIEIPVRNAFTGRYRNL
jgi:hypothetical protein